MRLFRFAYHALRSACWWVVTGCYGFASWCAPWSDSIRLGWGYSEAIARFAWMVALNRVSR